MLQAFANCVKIPELRKKILFTLFALALCRLAATVPVPGINGDALNEVFAQMHKTQSGGSPGLLEMFNMFTGGALQRFAVAALGIMPYITASIIMQLMTPIFPTLERWKREGESGMQRINQWTRYITLGICVVQGYISARVMENPSGLLGVNVGSAGNVVIDPGLRFRIITVIILTCGTMLLMWIGEQITDHGVGNGASLIITIGILERLPSAVYTIYGLLLSKELTIIHVAILIALFVAVTAATVALTLGQRKIPIQYARATTTRTGQTAKSSFFPLRVNYSSVMPIIFAQALLMFPPWAIGFLLSQQYVQDHSWLHKPLSFMNPMFTFGTGSYMFIYAALLILFAFFWVANQFNPIQIADDLKRNSAYIPGVRPGKPTAEYLDWSMTRVTMAGSLMLVGLALLPMFISQQMGIPFLISSFFGGSSLLIIVGVMLDTMRQVESHLSMHGYDTFMQHGRLRGRR